MPDLRFDPNSGVVIPTTQEVRDDLAAQFQDAFRTNENDPDLNVDPSSPMGQVVDLVTAEVEAKNAEVAFLANQYNPALATGSFLDALANLYGLTRKLSEPTVVTCVCTGLRGTTIPYGAIVQDGNGNQLRHNVVLGAQIGDSGTVETTFVTVEHGAIEIGAGTVNKIVTVIPGWDSVTNPAAGVLGRDREPDGELYSRMINSYAINANGSVAAIESNLAELDGVLDVIVLENYTNAEQTQFSLELKPHSIGVCIVGGDDTEIARVIFERKPAGTATTGNAQVTWIDEDHYNAEYVYNIVRPTAVDFDVQVTFFDASMDDVTQQAVKDTITQDFLGELTNARVKLATTVYASRFYRCVQAVTDSPIKQILIGLDGGELSTSVEIPAIQSPSISDETISLVFGG